MSVLAVALVAVQLTAVVGGAVLLSRRHRRDGVDASRLVHRTGLALLVMCVLPVPALLAADAPWGAWGLWGAGYLAAAAVYANADTYLDAPPTPAASPPARPS
ncbi:MULTISPECIES: hypothetical protein [Streptomyces]|uniref:hypothetical protein n=1 Tax=Streptomyces TaxID=1883 RepID=UPI003460E088